MIMSKQKIELLREFYVNKVRAKKLSEQYDVNVWEVIAEYRNLPQHEFDEVKELIYRGQ